MYYNVNDFKNYFEEKFEPWHFTSDDVDDLVCDIEKNFPDLDFTFEMGATKCVIIPIEADFVIKIPFDGENRRIDEYHEWDEFYQFTGGGADGWDYCDQECAYYEDVVKGSGFEKFFLPNNVLSFNWPVYIQQKAEIVNETRRETSKKSKEMVKEIRKTIWCRFPNTWLELCLEKFDYDVNKFKNFICFLDDNFSDLHSSNIGYLDDQPVIIDYAGYCEQEDTWNGSSI